MTVLRLFDVAPPAERGLRWRAEWPTAHSARSASGDLAPSLLSGVGIGSVLYLALLATLAAYTLWTRLLKRHAAVRVVPFSSRVPVLAGGPGNVAPAGQVADQSVGRTPRGRL